MTTQCQKSTVNHNALFGSTHYSGWRAPMPISVALPPPPAPALKPTAAPHSPKSYLSALMASCVQIRPGSMFNNPETRVFYAAQTALRELGYQGWHIHGQVSYGRIFKSSAPEDYIKAIGFDPHRAFNSKSADVVIADNEGMPVLVIEYQGSGHDPRNDVIKEYVCEKAGVTLLPIYPEPITPDQPLRDCIDLNAVKRAILREIGNRQGQRQLH